jgi:hypothetical protein
MNIRKLNEATISGKKAGRRTMVKFKEDIELMRQLKFDAKKANKAKSKRGIKRDNPTEKQARLRSDWPKFKEAIEAELKQISQDEKAHESSPVQHSQLPKGANVIGSMMILSVKKKLDKYKYKYKARLVMLGNLQKESSYSNVKAETVQNSTVKMLISLQAKPSRVSMVLDIKGAYLRSTMKEPE